MQELEHFIKWKMSCGCKTPNAFFSIENVPFCQQILLCRSEIQHFSLSCIEQKIFNKVDIAQILEQEC
jgi:hypothetical protein